MNPVNRNDDQAKPGMVERFMKVTGKARVFFGPAQSSALDHPMTAENEALLKQQHSEAGQWETVTRADGSTYIVPRRIR
ncbi:hypothetical protein [Arthrobacter sp. Br18]|uniref:hypothetical protein n=1 Tax=Arthrobacter sp. Br18 TaxID=1312954 RepID=UPI00156639A3|nr:hypothetical protein [Arthrobacter sp. Br18]